MKKQSKIFLLLILMVLVCTILFFNSDMISSKITGKTIYEKDFKDKENKLPNNCIELSNGKIICKISSEIYINGGETLELNLDNKKSKKDK